MLGNIIRAIVARYQDWKAREQAYAELSALDDRTLADIGIRRSDIPFILSGKYTPEPARAAAPKIAVAANGNTRDRRAA